MTAIPGTPQIQNLIPIAYFNTSPTAAPIIGITGGLIMAVGGFFYLRWRQKQFTSKGDVFTEPKGGNDVKKIEESELPNFYLSFLPLVIVVVKLNVFKWNILTALLVGILSILLIISSGASILPHNGALLTLFAVTGLTHKDSYLDVAVVGLLIPTMAEIVSIILANMGIY
jgi:H+/gluconate symporter-like permease